MSNYDHLTKLYETLTGKKQWSTTLFIKLCDNKHNVGIFLDRLIWWSDKGNRQDGYFWKTTEDWGDELGFTYAQVKYARAALEEKGYIKTKLKKAHGAPTIHYWVNIELIEQKIVSRFGQVEDSLNSDYAKFEKVEFEQSRISGNAQVEIRESATSDIRESQQSITDIPISNNKNYDDEESHAPEETKLKQIVDLYTQNITISIAPITAQEMQQAEYFTLPVQWWEEAIKIAADNNARKWTYVKGVLDRSIAAGQSPCTLGPPKKGQSNGRRQPGSNQRTNQTGQGQSRSTLDDQPSVNPYTGETIPAPT